MSQHFARRLHPFRLRLVIVLVRVRFALIVSYNRPENARQPRVRLSFVHQPQPFTMSRKSRSSNSALKLAATSVSLAALAYASYKYLSGKNEQEGVTNTSSTSTSNILQSTDSNPLRRKQERNTAITLVVTKSVLDWIKNYNQDHEDGIDLQNYLEVYPNLVIILYPDIKLSDIEFYFEFNDSFKHRILFTEKESSVFHMMKHLNNNINLININDFSMNNEEIDRIYRISHSLHNLIPLSDDSPFIQYI